MTRAGTTPPGRPEADPGAGSLAPATGRLPPRTRRLTREVKIGSVGVGGGQPIRLQSMTTSDTQDVAATVRQAIALAEVGCEIVRVTAPNVPAARCLRDIRAQFSAAGFANVPLVADIHFLPTAAMEAVEHVEKVRVNPGNYADRKKFAVREYSDADYERELQRLHEAFTPLVLRCRQLGRALRIGTNHGSLSDRIMNRYGDTPLGMVESALEFIRIAESHGFRDIVLSMKASNPKVMIQAYRLLAARLDAAGMPYPLHLGVTEAGDGEDGRIKSAIGIGSLLLDGLGDTIRVSLTEDSVYEIPVARALADKAMGVWNAECGVRSAEWSDAKSIFEFRNSKFPTSPHSAPSAFSTPQSALRNPHSYSRRAIGPLDLGASAPISVEQPPRVVVAAGAVPADPPALAAAVRAATPKLKDTPLEGLLVAAASAADASRAIDLARALGDAVACLVVELPAGAGLDAFGSAPLPLSPRLAAVQKFAAGEQVAAKSFLADARARGILPVLALEADSADVLVAADDAPPFLVTLAPPAGGFAAPDHAVGAWRRLVATLDRRGIAAPVWIRNTAATAIRHEPAFLSRLLEASILTGSLMADGIGDLVSIETEPDLVRATKLAYNVLQGAGARSSKTEFVACPSCGRTLFDLQTTTQRIRAQTGHLKGVKIAIMGCIVNGPGEMADADFGYVGGAPGRINLYVGRNCVDYAIPAERADQRLIELIKSHGKWVDPDPPAEAALPA